MLKAMRRIVVWIVLSLLLLGPVVAPVSHLSNFTLSPAYAQRSGGGVGGRGGFSNAPSVPRVNPSPSPSFPIPTSRSYPSYPTYPRDYYPSSPNIYVGPGYGVSGGGFDIFSLLVIAFIVIVAISIVGGLRRAGGGSGATAESTVARLRLSTLYSRELQQALRQIANNADTQTTKGLADLIDDSVVLMLREQAGWRFGGWELWTGNLTQAEGQFDQWMTETRSEFVETYRKFEGKVSENTAYKPQAEPDGRYILVSFVVAAHGVLPPVAKPLRSAGARAALMALSATTPVTTLAAYMSWTPEASGEALTEQDLLRGWPGLELL